MYHWIVKRNVRSTFQSLSKSDWDSLTNQLSANFRYEFVGEHSIGGTRQTHEAMRKWIARLNRLIPKPLFEIQSIAVAGMPWNTTVLIHVEVTSQDYKNQFFQRIRIRWGSLTDILTLEDLHTLEKHFESLAANGIDEAKASPIV